MSGAGLDNAQPKADEVFSQHTLSDFTRELGSAAVALALAAGCLAKAFAISARHNPDQALPLAADLARAIAALALEGAQRDDDDFRAWLKRHAPDTAYALQTDAQILVDAACRLESLEARYRHTVIDSLAADLAAAKTLLDAFRAIQMRNIFDVEAAAKAAQAPAR